MTTAILLTACPAPGCSEWEVQVFSEAEKVRLEKLHAERYHPRTLDAIAALVADDPMHERERAAVEDAIRVAARKHGGRVCANDWRPLIPSWVQPQLVGSVVQGWVSSGVLHPTGDEVRSTDTKGRNTNKPCPVYLLREAS